jgi:hypothetical protein
MRLQNILLLSTTVAASPVWAQPQLDYGHRPAGQAPHDVPSTTGAVSLGGGAQH